MSAEARIERLIASIERDLGNLDGLAARLEGARSKAPWSDEDPVLLIAALRR
ncbi:MAG TPA: hypothetical protein PK095_10330 [Myxococcota bacterium]|nr:hypothetical protein [Myxococcota bacterium]